MFCTKGQYNQREFSENQTCTHTCTGSVGLGKAQVGGPWDNGFGGLAYHFLEWVTGITLILVLPWLPA